MPRRARTLAGALPLVLAVLAFLAPPRHAAAQVMVSAMNGRDVAYAPDGRIGQVAYHRNADLSLVLRYREWTAAGVAGPWTTVHPAPTESETGSGVISSVTVGFTPDGRPRILHASDEGVVEVVRTDGVWNETGAWDPAPEGFGMRCTATFCDRPDGGIEALLMFADDQFDTSNNWVSMSTYFATLVRGSGSPAWEPLLPELVDPWTGGSPVMAAFDQYDAARFGYLGLRPRNASMARDATGAVHVVVAPFQEYEPVAGGTRVRSNLYYLRRATNGTWSAPEVLQTPGTGFGDGGLGACIAVAPDQTIAVAAAYLPRAGTGSPLAASLKYLVRQSNGTWASSTVASSADGYQLGDGPRGTGLEPFLAFDSASRPYIAFTDHASYHAGSAWSYSGQVRLATRASATAGAWTLAKLVSRGTTSPMDFSTFRPVVAALNGRCVVAATSWIFSTATFSASPRHDTVLRTIHAAAVPTVATVSPAAGPVAGGTTLTIGGTNLNGITGVTVGGVPATVVSANAAGTALTVRTPAGSAGPKAVAVTTWGGTATKANAFTYMAVPAITAVSPSAGPLAGNTLITVTGTGLAGATSVKVGSAACSSVTVNAAGTALTARTPAGSAGVRSVSVTTPGGTGTKAAAYAYMAAPTATSVSPAAGPLAGNTLVTVTGSNFLAGATTVLIGSVPATNVTVTSSTTLTARTGANTAGLKAIVVRAPGGQGTTFGVFRYMAAPTIASVSPSAGPATGNTLITVAGTNFLAGSTTVLIGGLPCTSVTVNAAGTSLTARTPAHSAGLKSMTVAAPGGTAALAGAYTYTANRRGSAGSPSGGGGQAFGWRPRSAIGGPGQPGTDAAVVGGSASVADDPGAPWQPTTGVPMVDLYLVLTVRAEPWPTDLDADGSPDLAQLRRGDLDLDGDLDAVDAELVLALVGRESRDGIADLDGDGWVTVLDVASCHALR